jgi:hypothetical protein
VLWHAVQANERASAVCGTVPILNKFLPLLSHPFFSLVSLSSLPSFLCIVLQALLIEHSALAFAAVCEAAREWSSKALNAKTKTHVRTLLVHFPSLPVDF